METYCVSCKKILRTKIQVSQKLKTATCGKKKPTFKNTELHNFND